MISVPQYQRSQRLRPSDHWTKVVRELYPPAAGADGCYAVVIAYDPEFSGGRWVLCYDAVEPMVVGAGVVQNVNYLKSFYVWQGPESTYLEPSALIADWLRQHDLFSGDHCGSWEDRHFKQDERLIEQRDKSEEDDLMHSLKDLYPGKIVVAAR